MKAFYICVGVAIGLIINLLIVPYIFSEYYDMKYRGIRDKYKHTSSKEAIPITKGVCNIVSNKKVIDTYDYRKDMYVDLKPSVNRMGGTQFSYSFWLRRATTTGLKNKILFFRGSEQKEIFTKGHIYNKKIGTGDEDYENNQSMMGTQDRFVKCPLVRFGENGNGLRVEFNTLKDPHMFVTLDSEIFSLLKSSAKNPKYNLISITFKDNFDFGGRERGIMVEAFIDDALVKTSSFENNALKLNKGPIVLFENFEDNGQIDADFAELTYHNHALTIEDVDQLYNKGFRDITCQLPDSWNDSKTRYTLGKVNLHNETKQINNA
jgi:hypothetical protein